ncbi:hypothetical protein [Olleya sp. ITB9]|uniref:hypothetical protein n=1 Tax=Olleya sp. ITB9 TaxID=1715648 RepID=UPI0006D17F07|nr:hypothetical protein [Olleya sp. ITB9]
MLKIKLHFFDILFVIALSIAVGMSVIMEKSQLLYICPVVIVTIFLKYISVVKKNTDPLFLLALAALFCINFLTFYSFHDYFGEISLLTSLYLILYTFSLKKYLIQSKLKSLLSISSVIGGFLVAYISYSVIELLLDKIPNNSQIYMFICAICVLIYTVTFAIVYLNNNYKNGTILLTSGLFSLFQIGLSPINEYLFYNQTFTVMIIICHFMAIYLFMKFISETKPVDPKNIKKQYF